METTISGIGIICALGRGAEALDAALRGAAAPAALRTVPGIREAVSACAVPAEAMIDKKLFHSMRRADRLSKLAVMAAVDAWKDGGLTEIDMSRVGVILATALGPHVKTFEFLDGILDYGEASVSPTAFSHSVHNAAASYIASALQTHGPTQTVTDFNCAFFHALVMARCWLDEHRCDAVLVGAAEEVGDVLLHVCARMRPGLTPPPGEGAVFFLLTRERKRQAYAAFSLQYPERPHDIERDVRHSRAPQQTDAGCSCGLFGSSTTVRGLAGAFGAMMTDTAFHCAAAAYAIKTAAVDNAVCAGTGVRGERQEVVLMPIQLEAET